MSFRQQEMVKIERSIEKCLSDCKVIMGRTHRGLYAGRHIQIGNRVSEKGGKLWLQVKEELETQNAREAAFSYIHVKITSQSSMRRESRGN